MSTQHLRCGCVVLAHACAISPACTASPKHTDANPPGGGRLGAAPPTPTATRKRAEAKESGRKLKPGKYRMPREGGAVVRVEDEDG